jgi:hypothetical protein
MVFLLLAPAYAVVINEIKPQSAEWIEVFNPTNDILNLSSWLIKDNSTDNPDNITCWAIPNCDLVTNTSYFLILGNSTNITSITNSSITYYYTDDSAIGDGLTDSGDNITFYNNSFATSFNYTGSAAGKSWQRVPDGAGNIASCNPTPGMANACSTQNASQGYDFNLTIESAQYFVLGSPNEYKFVTENLDYTIGQEDVYYNLTYWINSTSYVVGPNETSGSLRSQDTITLNWTPLGLGNFTICGTIMSSTANDTNSNNNVACRLIEVIDTSKIDCDLSITINNTKLIYLSGESIDYDLATNDAACSNFTHPYIVQYWIEDLFGNYLRTPYNSSGTMMCTDVKSPTKQAPSLCGSEVYFIKAAIVQPFCHDTNADNDVAEQMIVVKGSNPNSITCKSSSSSTSSNSTSSAKESPNFAVKISSVPNQVHQGETIVTKFSLTNSYTTMKTFDIYSYVYSGQKIASEGGWTGNKMSLQIPANDFVDASIINVIRQDAEPGKYSFRVRAALGDDKADDTVDMEVLPGNGTSLSNKSGEIVSFYTRTRNLVADDEVKLYANVKNLQNQNQTFELKLDNGTETIMLEKKASKTFNFSVRLPFEDSADYKLLLMQNSIIIDEKNLTLQIGENTNSIEKANISKKEATNFTGIADVNWSSKSSSNVAAILFSFALLLLSLSLLATAISSKRA